MQDVEPKKQGLFWRVYKFIKNHQILSILISAYLTLKILAFFVTADDEYLYATLHGHSDDILGAFLVVALMRRPFREKGYDSEKK